MQPDVFLGPWIPAIYAGMTVLLLLDATKMFNAIALVIHLAQPGAFTDFFTDILCKRPASAPHVVASLPHLLMKV